MAKKEKQNDKKNKRNKIIIIVLIILILMIGFCWYENNHLVVTQLAVANSKVPSAFSDYKILQISDLHNASFGKNNEKLINLMREQQPDIIVITGDIIDSNHKNIQVSLDFCKQIVDICPVYYITGNHEYWIPEEELSDMLSMMKSMGIVVLENESVELSHGEDTIKLIGLNDNSLTDDTLNKLIDNNIYNIVLAHEPQYINRYSMAGADLVLTGHAHGGQFILPFVGPVVAPDQGFRPKYTEGTYQQGDTTMVVSRGLGNSIIPVRLFNDPEIVVVVL